MKRGQHAADDGSFARSAGGAALRGAALIFVAVVVGVVLLNATEGSEPFTAEPDRRTTTTAPPDEDDEPPTETTVPARDPAEVRVLVANGSGIAGAAGRLTDQLNAVNYNVLAPGNTNPPRIESSAVYYAPGFQAEAEALARLLQPAVTVAPMPDPLPVDDLKEADVLIVLAEELRVVPPDEADPEAEGEGGAAGEAPAEG